MDIFMNTAILRFAIDSPEGFNSILPEQMKKCQKFSNVIPLATPFAVLFNPIAYIYEATAKCCY